MLGYDGTFYSRRSIGPSLFFLMAILRSAPVNTAASLDPAVRLAFPRGSGSGILAAFGIGAVALALVLVLVAVVAHVWLRCARVGIVEMAIRSSAFLRASGKCRERSRQEYCSQQDQLPSEH
jgi:hypothetical protein